MSGKEPKAEPGGKTIGMDHRAPGKGCPLCPIWGREWVDDDPSTWNRQHEDAARLWDAWHPTQQGWEKRVLEVLDEMGVQATEKQVKAHFTNHKIEQPMLTGSLDTEEALLMAHNVRPLDRAIINAVYRNHVLTRAQIREVFFSEYSKATAEVYATQTLRELFQSHFLYRYFPTKEERSKVGMPDQFYVYLGKRSIPYLQDRYSLTFKPSVVARAREVPKLSMRHDLLANEVYVSIKRALKASKGSYEDSSGAYMLDANPENWYGPGPQSLTMDYHDPHTGQAHRVNPDGFCTISVLEGTNIPSCQLPFFIEYDHGSKETKEVVEQMLVYHKLALSGAPLKRFPELAVNEFQAVPVLFVFSNEQRRELLCRRFRERADELGIEEGAPVFTTTLEEWREDPFNQEIVHSAWHTDVPPAKFMRLLVPACRRLIEAQTLTPSQTLTLDPKAARIMDAAETFLAKGREAQKKKREEQKAAAAETKPAEETTQQPAVEPPVAAVPPVGEAPDVEDEEADDESWDIPEIPEDLSTLHAEAPVALVEADLEKNPEMFGRELAEKIVAARALLADLEREYRQFMPDADFPAITALEGLAGEEKDEADEEMFPGDVEDDPFSEPPAADLAGETQPPIDDGYEDPFPHPPAHEPAGDIDPFPSQPVPGEEPEVPFDPFPAPQPSAQEAQPEPFADPFPTPPVEGPPEPGQHHAPQHEELPSQPAPMPAQETPPAYNELDADPPAMGATGGDDLFPDLEAEFTSEPAPHEPPAVEETPVSQAEPVQQDELPPAYEALEDEPAPLPVSEPAAAPQPPPAPPVQPPPPLPVEPEPAPAEGTQVEPEDHMPAVMRPADVSGAPAQELPPIQEAPPEPESEPQQPSPSAPAQPHVDQAPGELPAGPGGFNPDDPGMIDMDPEERRLARLNRRRRRNA